MAADIRCPMCGKSNPADAEVCRYCRARLSPVMPGGGASGGAPSGGDEPDWLRALRADEPQKGGKSPVSPENEPAADVPDWLSRIRQKASDSEKPAGGGLFADDEDSSAEPDWMKGLGGEESASADFGASDDWLSRLGGEPAQPPASGETGGQKSGEVDLSGWLASLDEQDASSGAAADSKTRQEPAQPADTSFGGWPGSSLFVDDEQPTAASQPAPSQPAASQASESEEDDWLAKLNFDRDETPPAAPTPAAQPPASQDQGWGAGLWADAESGGREEETTPAAAEDNLDWLRSFPSDQAAATGEELPAQPSEPETGADTSGGWGLTGWLNQKAVPPGPPAAQEPAPGAETGAEPGQAPDWLSDLSGAPAAGSAWFSEEPPAQDQPPASAPPAQEPDSGMPSWLAEEPTVPMPKMPPSESPAGGVPSWLMDETSTPVEPTPPAQAPESGIPSWLMDQPAAPAAQTPPPQAPESGVPGWLSGFDEEPTLPAPASQEPPSPTGAEGGENLPAWLRGDFGAEETVPAPRREPQAGDLPGWFSSFDEGAEPAQPAAAPSENEPPGFAFSPFSVPEEPARPEPAVPQPAMALTPPEEQPDWLTSLKAAGEESALEEEAAPEPKKGTGPLPFIDQGLPDWMSEFQGQPQADDSVAPLVPMEEYASTYTSKDQPFDIQLPDWIDEEAAQRNAEKLAQGEPGQPAGEDLAQAELPSWVAAMRPVETAFQGDAALLDTDQNIEKSGPLSGMRGVLPADEGVINWRKPPVYSVKLRVTEKQRGHTSLFESLIGQEAQPLVLPSIKSQAPQVVLRVLVALFMLVTLAGALMLNWQTPAPTLIPPDTLDLYDQLEALPAEQTVLLAVDFEPGLSGEMRFASATVIDHLMARNLKVGIVSTVPTGPAMADSLLKQAQQNQAEFDLAERVGNLGYLPGGTISLVEFARDPQVAAPQTVDGQYAWDQPALAGIEDIQDFSGVIVITDRAETGRDWVEQVQPYLGNVPLLFVSSAQAAPLLEPYVESRQVQGLVSGLMGGTFYGQQTSRQNVNPAMGSYGAYQVGVLLGFVLVLVGASFSAITAFVTRNKKNRE